MKLDAHANRGSANRDVLTRIRNPYSCALTGNITSPNDSTTLIWFRSSNNSDPQVPQAPQSSPLAISKCVTSLTLLLSRLFLLTCHPGASSNPNAYLTDEFTAAYRHSVAEIPHFQPQDFRPAQTNTAT
jgi:hypothetical protein